MMYEQEIAKRWNITKGHQMFIPEVRSRQHLDTMTERGVLLDLDVLREVHARMAQDLSEAQAYIEAYSEGAITKPNSARQVGQFFESLGHVVPRTGRGNYSGSAESLAEIDDPIVEDITKYRQDLSVAGQLRSIIESSEYGRVHPEFDSLTCATGRVYSRNPNIMGWSPAAQAAVRADDGYGLMIVDAKAQELRILAALSGCKGLRECFEKGEDPHARTAKMMLGLDEVTPEQRQMGKALNFGPIYGQTPQGLARKLHCSESDAEQKLAMFYCLYPEIRDFQREAIRMARSTGRATTYFGRQRFINYNSYETDKQDRQAVNTIIQGTAADLLKITLASLPMHSEKLQVLYPVHDSLVLQRRADCDPDKVKAYVESIMVKTINDVVLSVDWKLG